MAIDTLARNMAASASGGGGSLDVGINEGIGISITGDDPKTISNNGVTNIASSDDTADNGTIKVIFDNNSSKNKHVAVKGLSDGAFMQKETSVPATASATDTKFPTSKAVATALGSKIDNGQKGVANGVATLDSSAKLTSTQLPSHNQASSTINAMTGYTKPDTTSAIDASTDTLNSAIGKLEKALDSKQASGTYATGDSNGNAVTANKLANTASIGSANKGVYFNANGVPVAMTHEVNKDVPSDAKFTDTTYTADANTGVTVNNETHKISNDGVRGFLESKSEDGNGTFRVNVGGTEKVIGIKGLSETAFKDTDTTVKSGSNNPVSSNAVYSALSGKVNSSDVTDTYSSTGTDPVNGKAVKSALDTLANSLDATGASAISSNKTIKSWYETDGIVSISTQDIAIDTTAVTVKDYTISETSGEIKNNDGLNTAIGKLEKGIGEKQNALTAAQMNAVNSGITATLKGNYDSAYTHSISKHARTDATAVSVPADTNGVISIDGTNKTVYAHPGTGTNPHGTTKSDVGLGNVGNFKAVSTVASQGLTTTEKSNARTNLGLGSAATASTASTVASNSNLPTGSAVVSYVSEQIKNLPEPMVFKGTVGTESATRETLPTPSSSGDDKNVGWTYKVVADGVVTGAKVGDTVISTGTSWELIPSGDEPSGTVTSVAMTVPTGLTVTGSPITSSGTLAVSLASGYSIPTTANQTNWSKSNFGKVKVGEVNVEASSNGDTLTIEGSTGITVTPDTTNKKVSISTNAQANVIETVKVNGTALTPSSKAVDVTVPTKVSELTNDSGYLTEEKYKGTYSKPTGGIPKSDLASAVQTSLGLADTALQKHQSLDACAKTADLGDAAYETVRDANAVTHCGWVDHDTDMQYVPSMSFLAFWNGAYNSSGSSNLTRCQKGAFGTIVTKSEQSYITTGTGTALKSGDNIDTLSDGVYYSSSNTLSESLAGTLPNWGSGLGGFRLEQFGRSGGNFKQQILVSNWHVEDGQFLMRFANSSTLTWGSWFVYGGTKLT